MLAVDGYCIFETRCTHYLSVENGFVQLNPSAYSSSGYGLCQRLWCLQDCKCNLMGKHNETNLNNLGGRLYCLGVTKKNSGDTHLYNIFNSHFESVKKCNTIHCR